jgi:hypothetical protein
VLQAQELESPQVPLRQLLVLVLLTVLLQVQA